MVSGPHHATETLLRDTESVADAAERLRDSLDGAAADRDYAVEALERAGTSQEERAGAYRAFMFQELGADAQPEEQERAADDVIALAATDLKIGGVLVAAGNAVGETGPPGDPALLDTALSELRTSTYELERAARSADGRHFAFVDEAAPPARAVDRAEAIAAFRAAADEVLEALVGGVQGTAGKVIDKLPWARAVEALGSLGGSGPALPKVGRLLRLGLRKVEAALDALSRLVGRDALGAIKERIQALLEKAREGVVRQAAQALLDVEGARAHVAAALTGDLRVDAVNDGTDALAQLESGFKGKSRYLDYAVGAAGLLGTLGSATGHPGLLIASAAALVLTLAVSVLLAMDHADAAHGLRLVPGVREIADGLRDSR
jgi:hypothetical protein